MRVDPEFLRQIDPRKSYTQGPLALPAARGTPHGSLPAASPTAGSRAPARELAALSIEELRRELERRRQAVARLQEQRERIARELLDVDAELAALGHSAGAPGSGGPRADGPGLPRRPSSSS